MSIHPLRPIIWLAPKLSDNNNCQSPITLGMVSNYRSKNLILTVLLITDKNTLNNLTDKSLELGNITEQKKSNKK